MSLQDMMVTARDVDVWPAVVAMGRCFENHGASPGTRVAVVVALMTLADFFCASRLDSCAGRVDVSRMQLPGWED
jgi:hypothetical protein